MSEQREAKRLAKTLRKQTGIPLGAAHAIAIVLKVKYEKWSLDDHPKLKRWAKLESDWASCDCCGPSYHVVVTGPKGKWEEY